MRWRSSFFVITLSLAGISNLSGCSSKSGGGNAATSPWTDAPALPVARFEAYGAAAHGLVYFIGGITGVQEDFSTAQPSRRIDVLDPRTMQWTAGPELPADAPKHHLTVAVWNDAIYVLGGFDGILGRDGAPFQPIATAYVLEGAPPGTWRKLAKPPLARGGATAQAIDGMIYVTGGAPNEGEPFGGLGGNCGFRRSVWEALGGLLEHHYGSDDAEFFWRARLAGFDVAPWWGLFLPARTAPDVVARLHSDTIAVLAEPAIQRKLQDLGSIQVGSTPEELARYLQAEIAKWGPVIRDANIRLDG